MAISGNKTQQPLGCIAVSVTIAIAIAIAWSLLLSRRFYYFTPFQQP